MPYRFETDPKTGARIAVPTADPKSFAPIPKPEQRAGKFDASTVVTKAARDLTQEGLGNLPADLTTVAPRPRGGREPLAIKGLKDLGAVLTGDTVPVAPRKPGAPDAPILGVIPALPQVEASTWESNIAGFVQGAFAWYLGTRALGAAGRAAAVRVPGAAAVGAAARPVVQPLRGLAARATQAPGLKGVAGRVAVQTIKEAPASALVGYGAFKPEEQRVSDKALELIEQQRLAKNVLRWVDEQQGTPIYEALVGLVRSKPGDTAQDARWKNAIEGLLIFDPAANAVVEGIGLAAKAVVNRFFANQAATPTPAAKQVVDASAREVKPPVAPTPEAAAAPARPAKPAQPPSTAPDDITVETFGKARYPDQPLPQTDPSVDPWAEVAKADAEAQRAFDFLETATARAANTVPDVMGAVRPEARAVERPAYSQVRETQVTEIATDPQRFQFKAAGIGKTGVTGSLKEAAEYDPLFGKIISVWRDPNNGQLYVVNGHNRLDLARRSGRESILTWEIEAPTAEQARAIGAMENMAEGQGTPWDAAKIMRDMGMGLEELRQRNINIRGPIAERAIPLSRLPQEIFDRGVTGKLDLAKAVALGSEALDDAVIRDVAAAAGKGRWSAEKILQAMQEAKFAQTQTTGGGTIPGMEDWATKTSDFSVRADVRAEAYRSLREEMIALTSAARLGRKDILEAAGNVIDVAGSQAARDQAAQPAAVFNRVTGYTGPVRDLLNELVEQVKGGRTTKKVVADNLDRLRQAIEDELQGPRLPLEEPPAAAGAQDLQAGEMEALGRLGGLGKGIGASLRDRLWDAYQKGSVRFAGINDPALAAAQRAQVPTDDRAAFDAFLDQYGRGEVPAASEAPAAAPEVTPQQRDETKALLDRALVTLPPEKRTAVQAELERRATAPAAPVATSKPAFALPAELQRSAPRYGMATVNFANDLDRAAYVLANDAVKPSKAAPKFRQAVEDAGLDVAEVVAHGRKVKQAIKDAAGGGAAPQRAMQLDIADQGFGGRDAPTEPRIAVQPMGNAAAAAIEPPQGFGGRGPLASTEEFVPDPGMKPLDPEFVQAFTKELTEDIRRVAGNDVVIRFQQAFEMRQRPKEWGGTGSPGDISYVNGSYDPIKDLVRLNGIGTRGVARQRGTAFHEAFHRVQYNFLTEEELKALNSFWSQLKLSIAASPEMKAARKRGGSVVLIEQQAIAFQKFAYARKEGLDPIAFMGGATEGQLKGYKGMEKMPRAEKLAMDALNTGVRILDTLLDFTEKANNYIRGRGWTSINSIFEQAYSGELARTRQGLGNAYELASNAESILARIDAGENVPIEELRAVREGQRRTDILNAIRDMDTVPLGGEANRFRGRLFEEATDGPVPADPPAGPENSDDWVRRFARQLEANRQALLNGEVTMEDLMANNFQKVQSPSGRQIYTAQREDLVDGLNAMSKVLPDRPTESGIPVMDVNSIRRMNQDWFSRHGEDGEAIMAGLQSLTRGFDETQQGALNRAMAFADKKQVEAAQEAAMWLNSANFEGVNESERLARLITAAESSRAAHQAVMKVTRRWGQLGLEMQIPRDYDIPANQNVKDASIPQTPVEADLPPEAAPTGQQVDVDAEVKAELEAEQAKPIEETLTNKLDEELAAAANGGEITPKAAAAADALAQSLVSIAADSKARTKFWRNFDDTKTFTPNALLMLRTSNLISSGVTSTTNVMNGVLNLARLPLQQAAGAVLQGELKRSMYSLMMFQQYWSNMSNALRVAGHAFKAGQSLFNLENSSVDYLSRIAKQEAQGELLQDGTEAMTGWTVNTMNMGQEFAQTKLGQLGNHLWRVLGTGGTRVALTIDTFNSTLAGYAYEHIRHLPRGMELAVERGMKDMSPEAWKWAQQYADARTQETIKDVVINGKNLADVHMDSPRSQAFMDSVNFTDKIWADLEPRTYGEGVRIGQARGLEGEDLQAFAKQYVDEGLAMNKMAEFFVNGPAQIGRLASLPGEAWDTLSSARRVGPVFKFLQPFVRVPNNIIKTAARNTPAAAFVDTFWRDITSEDAFTRDRALGEMATGSAVLALVTMATTMGYVRFNGGGPQDFAARQRWTEIEGRMPYSVQFWSEEEGKWAQPVSMRAMEPFATLFGAIGDYNDIAMNLSTEARNRLGGSLVLTLARMSTSGVLSKSYFQGFTEMYEAFFNPSQVLTGPNQRDSMARYLSRLAASLVPHSSALRAARREVDPVARTVDPSDVGGLMGFFQETLDEVRNAVPGWSNDLPARRDYINGQPILTTGIIGSEQIPAEMPFLQALMQYTPMAAFGVGRQPRGPVHEEMARLHGKGTSFLGPRAADFGAEMRLSASELEEYTVTFATVKDQFGRTFEQSATELINSPQYQSWPIEGPSSRFASLRAAAIQEEIQRYKELAKEQYKATTAKGQLIMAEQAELELDRGEKNYMRRYGGEQQAQPSGAQPWSITPR